MEKLGMRREMHTTRDALLRTGEWADGLMYAILAEEWRAAPGSDELPVIRTPDAVERGSTRLTPVPEQEDRTEYQSGTARPTAVRARLPCGTRRLW
jgi:hypothetical protein